MADVRYQIVINNRVVCVCGVDGIGDARGVLSACASWVKRRRRPDDQVPGEDEILESHWFKVGGIDPATDEHVNWCNEPLKPGDEITIRVLGPGPADQPEERFKFDCQ